MQNLGVETRQIHADLANNLPEKIASFMAAMCGYDCERKKALTQSITSNYMQRLKNINIAENSLQNIIRGKYLEIITNLKLDLRIFLAANSVMFALLLVVSFVKPQAVIHLFLPAMLLLVATLSASGIYLFGQDWFYTILYNDYVGYSYLTYIGIIFAILLDIVMNRAVITSEVLNFILNGVTSVLPC